MRNKFNLLLLLLIGITSIGYSQQPTGIIVPDELADLSQRINCMGNEQDAGTWHIGNHHPTAQSNHVEKERIFLCAQDRVPLIHDRNESLDGDPDPTSEPGIGYGFYNCAPTIDGSSLTDIQNDPCQVPVQPPLSSPIYVIVDGNVEGDLLLNNDGSLNNNFNSGNPGTWWFAPITFDSLAINGGTMMAAYEVQGGNKGPCVNVRTDQAVEVTYLNPFEISNVASTPQGDTLCRGTFTIQGGLPEYDPDATYNIEIHSASGSQTGTVIGSNYGHGDQVDFTVPIGGEYEVTIQDGKSCIQSIPITVSCNTVLLDFPMREVELGESFCVALTADNFQDVLSLSYTLKFNPNVIEFDSIRSGELDMKNINISDINKDQGYVTTIWLEPGLNLQSLPDGSVLYEFCFTVSPNADIGDMSPLFFGNDPTGLEVGTINEEGSAVELGVVADHGKVTIVAGDELIFEWKACGTPQGQLDGTFTITAYNGTPPYTVDWVADNIGTTGGGMINMEGGTYTASGLDYDTYTVTITDSDGRTYTEKVIISSVTPTPGFNISVKNPSCYDEDDGELSLSNISASDPYSIKWSTGVFNTETIEDLSVGNYSVTLTDKYGCEIDSSRTVKYIPVSLQVTSSNVSCQGQIDGFARMSASGGQPINSDEYVFTFEDGSSQSTDRAMKGPLGYGWHSVTITDNNGCETVDSFFVDADKKLISDPLNINDVSCYGLEDGSISVTPATQGAPPSTPYTITVRSSDGTYQDSEQGTGTIDFSVPAATYTVTIADASGCNFDTTIIINQPPQITIDPIVKDETCTGGSDGYIVLHASGGAGNLQYQWSGGIFPPPPNDSIWQLSAGDYDVTITDDNGCTRVESFTVEPPNPPVITTIDSTSVSCAGTCDGELSVQATPGGSPLSDYMWVNANNDTTYSQTLTDACNGTYQLFVFDEAGCYDSTTVFLGEPQPLDTTSVLYDPPTCYDGQDGSLTLSVTGGVPPYSYQWSVSGAPDDATLSNIGAGNYSVSITDSNGCGPITASFDLSQPPAIEVEYSNLDGTSCYNSCDGGVIVNASGGALNGPFTYQWEDGTTGNSNNTLCAGENYVIVSDPVCSDTFYFNIPSPEAITFNYVDSIPPTCNGESDGRLEVTGVGGTGTFIYEWGDGTIDPFIEDLTAGDYALTITDGQGCILDTTINLGEPAVLDLAIDSTSDISCAGEENGFIATTTSGGNGGYTYAWTDNVSASASANGLQNGFYGITVTDQKGCTDTISTILSSPPPIDFNVDEILDPACNGDSTLVTVLNASGGNGGPFQAVINGVNFPIPGASPITAGEYTLEIIDSKDCSVDTTIVINEPPPINVDLPPTVEITLGDSATLQPVISNLTSPIDAVQWTPPAAVSCDTCQNVTVSLFENVVLNFTVTDDNGCIGEESVEILIDKSRRVYLPNAFSPNGDGVNEIFKIYANSSVEKVESFTIYNRWGSKIWERTDIPLRNNASIIGWNGTAGGRTLKPNVFMFSVELLFKDGIKRIYKGDITILASQEYD